VLFEKLKSKPSVDEVHIAKVMAKQKRKKLLVSVVTGMIIIGLAYQIAQMTGNNIIRDAGMLVGIMVLVLPLIMKQIRESKRRDSIDANLAIFILALVSSVQSGASLLRAIEDAANRNMGSLTPELKNLRANISWGMPYHEIFAHFVKRLGTRLAQRVGVLLQISMNIGGDVVTTLELIQKHVTEMGNIEKERKQALAPYLYTIYISYVVFVTVTILLVSQFFVEIETVQQQLIEISAESDIPLGMFGAILGVDVPQLTEIMFHMSLIEALFGGVAAGKIASGSFAAGIKHVIIMMIMAIVIFAAMGAI